MRCPPFIRRHNATRPNTPALPCLPASLCLPAGDDGYSVLKMPSGEQRLVLSRCTATIGVLSNPQVGWSGRLLLPLLCRLLLATSACQQS